APASLRIYWFAGWFSDRTRAGDGDGRRLPQRLIDDAVTLGEAHQRIELLVGRIRVQVEPDADASKADRCLFRHAHGSAKIEVAFDVARSAAELDARRGRDGIDGDAGARRQRFEQHVAGAGECAGAAGRRMQSGFHERLPGTNAAADAFANLAA